MANTKRIYVASSWRNTMQELAVHTFRAAGFDVYDFKHPHATYEYADRPRDLRPGFSWDQVGLVDHNRPVDTVPQADYLDAIDKAGAVEGYTRDMDAMQWADTFVLILPCGRSAHLELGWAVGAGKRTAVLLDDPCTPELMYRMVDYLAPNMMQLLGWLGVKD